MTYAYYHNVIKGKSPKKCAHPIFRKKKRPSLRPAGCAASADTCYDGEVPFEELPEDYTCPVCRQPKSNSSGK